MDLGTWQKTVLPLEEKAKGKEKMEKDSGEKENKGNAGPSLEQEHRKDTIPKELEKEAQKGKEKEKVSKETVTVVGSSVTRQIIVGGQMKCARKQKVGKKASAVSKLEESGTCAQCQMEAEDGERFRKMKVVPRSQ